MRFKQPFLLLLFFSSFGLFAQVSGGINDGLNYGFTLIPTIEKSMDKIEGTPYYNENFVRGTVRIEEKEPLQAFLRYNVSEERIEIKTNLESPRVYQLPAGSEAEFFIDSEKFILDKISADNGSFFGYFVELTNGDKYRLLKKPIAHLQPGEKAKTGYGKDEPARIKIEEEYFIVPHSGKAVHVRAKSKDLKNAFNTQEVEAYLKDHKIKSEEDLVKFVSFLNS